MTFNPFPFNRILEHFKCNRLKMAQMPYNVSERLENTDGDEKDTS